MPYSKGCLHGGVGVRFQGKIIAEVLERRLNSVLDILGLCCNCGSIIGR